MYSRRIQPQDQSIRGERGPARNKARIEAKIGLATYGFTMRSTLQEEKPWEKYQEDDKDEIEKAVRAATMAAMADLQLQSQRALRV